MLAVFPSYPYKVGGWDTYSEMITLGLKLIKLFLINQIVRPENTINV